jgi:hypothetical protein
LRAKEEDGEGKMFGGTNGSCNEIVYSKEQLRRNCKIKNLRPKQQPVAERFFSSSYFG